MVHDLRAELLLRSGGGSRGDDAQCPRDQPPGDDHAQQHGEVRDLAPGDDRREQEGLRHQRGGVEQAEDSGEGERPARRPGEGGQRAERPLSQTHCVRCGHFGGKGGATGKPHGVWTGGMCAVLTRLRNTQYVQPW